MLETFSYYGTWETEIKVGEYLCFGQLVNGDEDIKDIFESGVVAIYDYDLGEYMNVEFEVYERHENILDSPVKITDIY